MTKFEDRDRAFEAHFALEQDQIFRSIARRNKLFGLWAAERMGLPASEAHIYAKRLIDHDLERPGDDNILERVAGDFYSHGICITPKQLRQELERLYAVAKEEIFGPSS